MAMPGITEEVFQSLWLVMEHVATRSVAFLPSVRPENRLHAKSVYLYSNRTFAERFVSMSRAIDYRSFGVFYLVGNLFLMRIGCSLSLSPDADSLFEHTNREVPEAAIQRAP